MAGRGPLARTLFGGGDNEDGDGKEDNSWLSRQAKPLIKQMEQRITEARKEMEPILNRAIDTQEATKVALVAQNKLMTQLVTLVIEQNALLAQLVSDVSAAKKP